LLLERCGQGLNLIFLLRDLCRLFLGRGLQLLHGLTLFRRLRRGCATFAELACTRIYADRGSFGYTHDALDIACVNETKLSDADPALCCLR
jgi:hypothetical protein